MAVLGNCQPVGSCMSKQIQTLSSWQVFFALILAAMTISQSSSTSPDSMKAKNEAISIFLILDRKSTIDSSDEFGMTLEKIEGEIELRHVNFRYPTIPDVQIFQDLCLTIQSGKTVALVGECGSGKSTMISLLQRFYDPDSVCEMDQLKPMCRYEDDAGEMCSEKSYWLWLDD